jgi:Ca-activated chloride channel family protein
MMRALALFGFLAAPVAACETALVLAIDISGSIDAGEYALQVEGLAAALRDPAVVDALVQGQVALTVVHWSGVGAQAVALPWQRMLDAGAVARYAARTDALPRAFTASDTAVGEAISYAQAQFAAVSDCRRRVIDISGDGPENAGFTVGSARQIAQADGIEINAIAIEDMGNSAPISSFYRRWVITRGGFVMTARGLGDYPRAIREKLLRELTKPGS